MKTLSSSCLGALVAIALLSLLCSCTSARVGNASYKSFMQNRDITGVQFIQTASNAVTLKIEKSSVTGDAAMVDAAVRAGVAAASAVIAAGKSGLVP